MDKHHMRTTQKNLSLALFHTRTQRYTHTYIHTHPDTGRHTHAHTHVHIHTYTHTHTHAHAHARSLSLCPSPSPSPVPSSPSSLHPLSSHLCSLSRALTHTHTRTPTLTHTRTLTHCLSYTHIRPLQILRLKQRMLTFSRHVHASCHHPRLLSRYQHSPDCLCMYTHTIAKQIPVNLPSPAKKNTHKAIRKLPSPIFTNADISKRLIVCVYKY